MFGQPYKMSFDDKYRLVRLLGSGSFGEVYEGVHIRSGELVAVKVEQPTPEAPQLMFEIEWYKLLQGYRGVPYVKWYGTCRGGHTLLVMEMLGSSLQSLLKQCGGRFSLATTLMLGDQMLQRVEYMHGRGVIHRDLKPDNFLMGNGTFRDIVHVIDFGLMKRYANPLTDKHIPYREHKNMSGTPRFTSIHNHLGIESSRRDDVEAVCYILLYFLRGKLPWMGKGEPGDTPLAHQKRIGDIKLKLPPATLCDGLPGELCEMLQHCRALHFTDTPDYALLRGKLHSIAVRHDIVFDCRYDWT